MDAFATVQDIMDLARPLTEAEAVRAGKLLDVVSARLRMEAFNRNRDLDQMIAEDTSGSLIETAKSVTVDIVIRTLNTPNEGDQAPLSQFSQSALGYTFSGTYASGGGGIFIKNSELAALGLKRPRYGVIDLAGGQSC